MSASLQCTMRPSKLEMLSFSKLISTIYNVSWHVTADSYTGGQCLNLVAHMFDIWPSFCVT